MKTLQVRCGQRHRGRSMGDTRNKNTVHGHELVQFQSLAINTT